MVKPLHQAIAEVSLVALLGVLVGVLITDAPIHSVLLPVPQTSATQPLSSDSVQVNTIQSTQSTTQSTTNMISE
ncbi:hypothetical protein [Thermocoleostomius sinensis]|uniref:Uncharacterized protein n=1 Tax=Thermocoleostomius sinensis A174 TaxID=2016057 RepID=A0A9E9CAW2_9CYAN|nr:hypothetical protein [Thermocoleostomius sinensis]WAL59420.1 hypothetical protein OXH18_19930 [Thermocoleostomius sinensis A174]